MGKAIGIDLGHTSSMAAYFDEHQAVRVLETREGDATIPSTVAVREGKWLVGRRAVEWAGQSPDRAVVAPQLLLGRGHPDPLVKAAQVLHGLRLAPAGSDPAEDAQVIVDGQPRSPVDLTAEIFRAIKREAEASLVDAADSAVISVPARASAREMAATRQAAAIAGFKGIDLIEEPVAAAVAFGVDLSATAKAPYVVVFDLDDDRFDASILLVSSGAVACLATAGEPVHAKEAVTPALMGRTAALALLTLSRPGVETTPDKVGSVLLVGGASQDPLVRRLLAEVFPKKRIKDTVDPKKCIAYGAAMIAGEPEPRLTCAGGHLNPAGHTACAIPGCGMALGRSGHVFGAADASHEPAGGGRISAPAAEAAVEQASAPAFPVPDEPPAAPPAPPPSLVGVVGRAGRAADEQYFACLAARGRRDALERLGSIGTAGVVQAAGYYLAVSLASEGEADQAIARLIDVITAEPEHAEARNLAFQLLTHRAERAAFQQDWPGLAQAVTDALQYGPRGAEASGALERFKHTLPIGHLRTGSREKAAAAWQHQFSEHPDDTATLHNLALLHYWWARSLEDEGQACPVAEWRAAVAMWTLLVNDDAFWNTWAERKARSWGLDVVAGDLQEMRGGFLDAQFLHGFQSRADDGAQHGDEAKHAGYDACLTALALERASASAWRDAIACLHPSNLSLPMLRLPGGMLFFERFGLVADVLRVARQIDAADEKAAQSAARVRLYFSDRGLGMPLVLAESRNQPDEAMRMLDALPGDVRASEDARYVQAVALGAQAASRAGHGQTKEAMAAWDRAIAICGGSKGTGGEKPAKRGKKAPAQPAEPAAPADPQFVPLFAALRAEMCQQAARTARKDAERLKAGEKLDQAVELLEDALRFSGDEAAVDLLCVCLCDRGQVTLKAERYAQARRDFERTLELKHDYDRARQGLATTYNNEGVDASDPDEAIRLLRKSLELQPDGQNVRRNLAGALRTKAVKTWNALGAYDVRFHIDGIVSLLEEAVKLAATNIKDEAVPLLQLMAEVNPDMIGQLLGNQVDPLLGQILKDLATMVKARKQVRGY
jgi:tetratricopeptide (TPR) repeat protein